MTKRSIPFAGDPHERVQSLLPWFVTGRLDAAEWSVVEAHLSGCPRCRAEERLERRLEAEVAGLPTEVEPSWIRMKALMDGASRPSGAGLAERLTSAWRRACGAVSARPNWLGLALAAQAALLLLLGSLWPPAGLGPGPTRYHVLSAAAAPAVGNVLVIFRPETLERELRATLTAAGARVVDGPTAADAYVLHVPAKKRAAALAALRRRVDIVMAAPIDDNGPP